MSDLSFAVATPAKLSNEPNNNTARVMERRPQTAHSTNEQFALLRVEILMSRFCLGFLTGGERGNAIAKLQFITTRAQHLRDDPAYDLSRRSYCASSCNRGNTLNYSKVAAILIEIGAGRLLAESYQRGANNKPYHD